MHRSGLILPSCKEMQIDVKLPDGGWHFLNTTSVSIVKGPEVPTSETGEEARSSHPSDEAQGLAIP